MVVHFIPIALGNVRLCLHTGEKDLITEAEKQLLLF